MTKTTTVAAVILLIAAFNVNLLGVGVVDAGGYQLELTEIAEIHTGGRICDVYVNGDVLYALDRDLGLQIFNISNPAAPEILSRIYDVYTFAHGLWYANDLIFIADYEDKLEIVNVSNSVTPRIIGRYRETDNSVQRLGTTNLHGLGNLVFLASQGEGLEIIDVEDPANPVEIGNYYGGASINVVYAFNNLACIREMGGSFKILNISAPATSMEIYQCTDVNAGHNFVTRDNLLYVPDQEYGLRVYDIADPANAVKKGEKQIEDGCIKCAIEERGTRSYAFMAAEQAGVVILDVTNPQAIEEIGHYDDGGRSFSIFIQNDLVFVAELDAGLEILQIKESRTSKSSFEFPFVILCLGLISAIRIRRTVKCAQRQAG
ncbi:MAG: LVIVD repeat-containing protein [Candidatus Hodarchaeales archaeon]|jgi:hypothetical protein